MAPPPSSFPWESEISWLEDDVQPAERRGAAAIFTFRRGERWEEDLTRFTY